MILATRQNMRDHAGVPGVVVWSPETGEVYSAAPGDYWDDDGAALKDEDGHYMVLAKRIPEHYKPLEASA